MRKRSVACLCLLMIAVMLLSACDVGGGNPANTPVPRMTSEPAPPTGEPEEEEPEDWDDEDWDDEDWDDDWDDEEGSGLADGMQANAGLATAGPGLPAAPESTPTPPPAPRLTPDPAEEPIPVDPLDKPTQVPLNLSYVNYRSTPMGVAFDRPAGWKEDNPADSNVQFWEPESAARGGYRAMLTVRVIHKGSRQDRSQARTELEALMEEMAQNNWEDFRHNPPATASLSGASGYYTFYYATFNGIKLRGRIIVVARGNSLYMMRITSTDEYFSLYESIYRTVRESWTFL